MTTNGSTNPPNPMRRNRTANRRIGFAVLIVLGIGLALFHSYLLRAAYGILVVNQPTVGCRNAMIITRTPECYDIAAQLLADKAVDQLLLVNQKPRRAVRLGALPSNGELAVTQLAQRGVNPKSYRVIDTQAITSHQLFRELDADFRSNERANCIVISSMTLSRHTRNVIDQALPAERADHYRLLAVPPQDVDASTWWRTRKGARRILNHGLRLIFVLCNGESEVDRQDPYIHLAPLEVTPMTPRTSTSNGSIVVAG